MLWLRALHIIFVVCWFAGLFYLPRIFVYFAASEDSATRAQLAVMSRRLYRFVTPFMVLTVIFGVWMITLAPDYYLGATWLWLKLAGHVDRDADIAAPRLAQMGTEVASIAVE